MKLGGTRAKLGKGIEGWNMIRSSFPDCTCTFKDRCKLREHLRSHTQEKVVACPTCGGMFANNTKFLDHIRRQTSLDRKQLELVGYPT